MNKMRTGIVGPGKVAHLISDALGGVETSDYTAVCGRNAERTGTFAGQYGLKAYTDVGEMVRKEKLDVVIVCTPHPAHREPTVTALEEGANVLVEKPLASSLADCDAMSRAAEKAGKILGMISQRRFYAPVQRIRRAIDEGKLGRPVLGTVELLGWRDENYYRSDPWRGTWEGEGGGLLVNQAPHQIDLLQSYMGEVGELYAYWSNFNHPYIEVEDTSLALIKFRNGALGNLVLSNSQKPGIHGTIRIHGKNGASLGTRTDGGAMFVAGMSEILEAPVTDLWNIPGEEHLLDQFIREDTEYFRSHVNPLSHYHALQISDFNRAVMEGGEPLVTDREGRVTVEIFTAIYLSAKTGLPVKWPLTSG